VSFGVGDAYGGFAEVKGQVRLDGEELVLEFQVKDSFVGALKSGVKELRLPLSELEELSFRKGLFRRRLTLRARGLSALADLPGADGACVVLSVVRADADAARDLASHVTLLLSEQRLREVEEEARAAADELAD
jgi:hypothetical protein